MEHSHQEHIFGPIYDKNSKILILGSFPSVKSREIQFYYGHPQNRFWKIMANLFSCEFPSTIEEKKDMLLKHHVALWDVIASCDIVGSSDSSIKNVLPNDLQGLLQNTKINKIFVNGKKAESLYKKYIQKTIKMEAVVLPSSSPANAVFQLDKLCESWKKIINMGEKD